MTRYESKLLVNWQRHHDRGVVLFVLVRGVLFFAIPFAGTAWLFRVFIFRHHALHWDEIVYFVGVALVFGVIKTVSTWRKMERIYEDSKTEQQAMA